MSQNQEKMLTYELQIAERARKLKGEALHSLNQFITEDVLFDCFKQLNKHSASGIDGMSWHDYELTAKESIPELLNKFKLGTYRAPNIRRIYIPKDNNGSLRPIGIPTVEDKILQAAVRHVLEAMYEEDFKDFSYGFRKGRSAHQALDYMFKEVTFKGMRYIIDADIKNYFGSINHGLLREFLSRRVNDGVICKMIDKWLKAGVLDKGQLSYPTEGSPQGGLISTILSNIFLHYVLDVWYLEEIQPLLKGKSFIVRYADDYVLGFTHKEDAERVMKVLPKRFGKYGLELHPEKTRLIDLMCATGNGDKSFDFLGFTHYMGKSQKGYPVLMSENEQQKVYESHYQHRSMRLKPTDI